MFVHFEMSVCVFGFNVAFNNFSVISRRCLVATGSSLLTLIVLLHWSIMSQTLDMIPHPVTLSWHWVDQFQLYPVSLSAKRGAASTIFYDFGMSRPGIEPVTSRSPERTSTNWAIGAGPLWDENAKSQFRFCEFIFDKKNSNFDCHYFSGQELNLVWTLTSSFQNIIL